MAEATRRAVQAWGLEVMCLEPKEYSSALTAVLMPEGHSADAFRKVVLENFNMSLGNGLNKVADKVFRIGHLGDFNELMLMGTLAGVEMGLGFSGVPHQKGRGRCRDAVFREQSQAVNPFAAVQRRKSNGDQRHLFNVARGAFLDKLQHLTTVKRTDWRDQLVVRF